MTRSRLCSKLVDWLGPLRLGSRSGPRFPVFALFASSTLSSSKLSLFLSGQPCVRTADLGVKHIVFSTFSSTGRTLPPVIITGSDKKSDLSTGRNFKCWTSEHNKYLNKYAYVYYVPDMKQLSSKEMEMYLEAMSEEWKLKEGGKPCLLLDVAPWHTSRAARDLWSDYRIDPAFLPATTGKWLNPNDQAIHREMRRSYNGSQLSQPRDKLKNIIDAYYGLSEETVLNSFKHTRILEGDYGGYLRAQSEKGFHATAQREGELQKASEDYKVWAKTEMRNPACVPGPKPPAQLETQLDGVYWNTWGRHKPSSA